MTTRESILLYVRWGSKFIIDPCLYRNKHWRMPWSQQFICVECKPWVRGALAKAYSRMTLTANALIQSRQVFTLAKDHWLHRKASLETSPYVPYVLAHPIIPKAARLMWFWRRFMLMCFLFAILVRPEVLKLWSVATTITAKQCNKALINNASKRRLLRAVNSRTREGSREHGWIYKK